MTNKEFYCIYISALEEAFKNDSINYGFSLLGPDFYIEEKYLVEINDYIDAQDSNFLDGIAYYFDAKSHNFPSIEGVDIEDYKKNLMAEMQLIKMKYDII